MTHEEKLNEMAKACGPEILEKLKVEKYRKSIKKDFDVDDEIAILKEALISVLNAVALFHPEITKDERYKNAFEYYNLIEAKKLMVKEELGLLREGGENDDREK